MESEDEDYDHDNNKARMGKWMGMMEIRMRIPIGTVMMGLIIRIMLQIETENEAVWWLSQ